MDDVLPALPPPRRHALEVALLVEEAHEPLDPRALGVAVRSALELLALEQPRRSWPWTTYGSTAPP